MSDLLESIKTSFIITTWHKLAAIKFCSLSILFRQEDLIDCNFTGTPDIISIHWSHYQMWKHH